MLKSPQSPRTIPYSLLNGGKLTTEIWWALKQVVCGYSDNSVTDLVNTFKVMFVDSKIVSKMELGKNKLKYVVNYGTVSFFAEGFKKQVSESEWLAFCCDESLNKVIQESEVDLVLRFWDTCKNKVQVYYWDSMFLGYATAVDLLKKINDGLAGLDLSKQIQLSMDGSNVNWKVLSDMIIERDKAGLNNLVNIGNCNLLVVCSWSIEISNKSNKVES